MKRLLLSVFAAAITAVFAVPAMATDFTFSGEYRVRGEYRGNPTFEEDDLASSLILQRVRLTTNAQATDDTSVKITLQDSRQWGIETGSQDSGPSLTDNHSSNFTDLHESYVNVANLFDTPLSLRVGRQEFNYGDQRLIGPFGWNNNGRSFDAAKLTFSSDAADVDLFGSKINEGIDSALPNGAGGSDDDQDFYGIHATVKSIPNNTINVYALLLRDGTTSQIITNNTGVIAGITSQDLYTIGARLAGNVSGLDYTLEVPFQTGSMDSTVTDYDISAWAFAAKAGYKLPTAMKIRVGAEFDWASGDDDSTDGDIETFSNLFPTNHGHYGFMDQQAWRNMMAWSVNAGIDVTEQLNLYAAYWSFSLAEDEDAWYGAGNWNHAPGSFRAASSSNTEDQVGSEIDVVANYKYNSALAAQLGYGHFFVGDFLEQTSNLGSSAEDMDWAYLQLTANF